ncbi:MAG TPA: adenylate/guanylate cyclase domain-containing protein [Azospirillaceae bacterium]|nr:adenylate/guanylate cyclase domain-containing protein [Azospirillaceae bacterium]
MIRRLRLATGLVLFAFLCSHLVNLALGLVSLAAVEAAGEWIMGFWYLPPVEAVLALSLVTHVGLAFAALYRLRSLRMPVAEATQYALGLLVPVLLVEHLAGTAFLVAGKGVDLGFREVLLALWTLNPGAGALQSLLVVIAWVHVCIGLTFWLRLRPWFRPALPLLYAGALLLPVLGLLGFAAAGREVAALAAADPGWTARETVMDDLAAADGAGYVARVTWTGRFIFLAALLGTLAARLARHRWERRHGVVRLTYPDGREVELPPGGTVLEASRLAGIPHASVCGGKARCSTCRVRVGAGADALPPPGEEEARVLRRIGAPPMVRLACQLRPTAGLAVTPLVPPDARARGATTPGLMGEEREIAVLFCDIRGFTRFSDERLPYDVVFVLNRYFAEMGQAVEEAGGRVDKFIGDGVMALFGLESGPAEGSRAALDAARRMGRRLEALNRALGLELKQPLRIGIGIHAGPAIVGEMGHGPARALTAIGDTVNIASRLEGLTKEFGAVLVLSDVVAAYAGLDLSGFAAQEAAVRGKGKPVTVRVVHDLEELPAAEKTVAATPLSP